MIIQSMRHRRLKVLDGVERSRATHQKVQPLFVGADNFYVSSGLDFWFTPAGAKTKSASALEAVPHHVVGGVSHWCWHPFWSLPYFAWLGFQSVLLLAGLMTAVVVTAHGLRGDAALYEVPSAMAIYLMVLCNPNSTGLDLIPLTWTLFYYHNGRRPVAKREKHEHYDVDFKRNAVRLSNHPNIQTKDVAGVLKIHPFMLSRWKKEFRRGAVKNGNENSSAARLEKAQQRSRNWKSSWRAHRVENDLLKKARRFLSEGKVRPMPTSKGTGKNSR